LSKPESIELFEIAIRRITKARISPNAVALSEKEEILLKLLNKIKTPREITTPGKAYPKFMIFL